MVEWKKSAEKKILQSQSTPVKETHATTNYPPKKPSWNVNQIPCSQCADPVAVSTAIQHRTAYVQFVLRWESSAGERLAVCLGWLCWLWRGQSAARRLMSQKEVAWRECLVWNNSQSAPNGAKVNKAATFVYPKWLQPFLLHSFQDALRKKQQPPVSSTPVSASSPVNSSTQTINPSTAVSVSSLSNQSTPTHVDHNTAQPTVLLHNIQSSSADKEVSCGREKKFLSRWPLPTTLRHFSSRKSLEIVCEQHVEANKCPQRAGWRRQWHKTSVFSRQLEAAKLDSLESFAKVEFAEGHWATTLRIFFAVANETFPIAEITSKRKCRLCWAQQSRWRQGRRQRCQKEEEPLRHLQKEGRTHR